MELNFTSEEIGKIGIVVPTLGNRKDFLFQSLESINNAGCKNIILVGPVEKLSEIKSIEGLYAKIIDDPGAGLPAAINVGIAAFSGKIKYVGWLGDDDLLTRNSLIKSINEFLSSPSVVATYGACCYIDDSGKSLFLNKSGKWASKFMIVLPNLIPQPGSIFLRSAYEKVGGVKATYPLSFDFELFFHLRKEGELRYIPNIQGCFRWHSNSMSVDQRRIAVLQTSEIRKKFLPRSLRKLSFIWEPVIIQATKFIGWILQIKSKG